MKFKKFLLAILCALCAACLCVSFAACGGDDDDSTDNGTNENGGSTDNSATDPDANLADGTYVFYVYLDDGTTPVEGAQIQICYNVSDKSSTCYGTIATTDTNGRAEIDLSALSQYNAYNTSGLCAHFNTTLNVSTMTYEPAGFPDGYTYPSGLQTIELNVGSYEHAWYITDQVTTFKLVKE